MMNVVAALFGGILPPLSEFVPRLVVSAILGSIGMFALFESMYLRSQVAQFGSRSISAWLMVFQVAALAFFVCSVAVSAL
jgi:hypothetical protein